MNQKEGWNSHLAHCRDFIIRAVELYNPSHITVLGSGWLLDLPLAEMVEKQIKVSLIDIVHPPDVLKQAADIVNVEVVELDVTGGLINEVWEKTGGQSVFKKRNSLSDIFVPEYTSSTDPGLVISLNILTQLESRIIEFLRRWSKVSEEELIGFRSEIQRKHVDFLKKHNSLIITDYAEEITNRNGDTTIIKTLLTDLPVSRLKEEWIWDFDLKGSDYYMNRSLMKVIALAN